MISIVGQIPISISKTSLLQFAQTLIRKQSCLDIFLKYFTIVVDLSNFKLEDLQLIYADNQIEGVLTGQLPCKLKSKLYNKEILAIGKFAIKLNGLEISDSKQFQNIQIQIESLKFQGINSFLVKPFLIPANDAIRESLAKELPAINQVVLENLKKTYPIDFKLDNQIFKNFLSLKQLEVKNLEYDSMHIRLKIGYQAKIMNQELSHALPPVLSEKNDIDKSIIIGFSPDFIAAVLAKHIQKYSIPVLNRKLPLKLQYVNIVDQTIKIGISIVVILEASYEIEFSISIDNRILNLHLLKIQPKHSASLLQLGITKAVQLGIKTLLDKIGKFQLGTLKNKIQENIKPSYHFNTNDTVIKLNIPDFEIANVWVENQAICLSIEWKDEFVLDL